MGRSADLWDRVGRSQGEPYRSEDRKIRKVVAHVRHLVGREAKPTEEIGEELRLVFDSLMNLSDPKVGHPRGNGRGGPSGEDRHLKPGELGARQGDPILDVKDLPHLSARTVVEAPVGEDPINIENQEADGAGSTRKGPGRPRGATGGHTILARRRSWRWMIPAGRSRSSTMMSWVMA